MKQCIICLKNKEIQEFSEEHIFPKALGGTLKIYNCCKKCNELMGGLVDDRLNNLKFTEIVRFLLKIKGRSGVPNPFNELMETPYDGVHGHLKINKKGEFKGFEVKTKPVVNTKNHFVVVGDSKNPKEILNAIKNKVKKYNQKPFTEQELVENIKAFLLGLVDSINIGINSELEIEYLEHISPAILKIAFELAWKYLGQEYLNDTTGNEIRTVLYDITEGKTDIIIPTDISFDNLDWNNIKRYHSARIITENNYIVCYLNILNFIKGKVIISEQAENYNQLNELIELNF
ncbi:HNH endonuclease [Clostridium sp.]|uniref:HNH endonuclease n=1 Tax=Clostridium sp. TaxID=1506 RepID=UPI0035A17FEF